MAHEISFDLRGKAQMAYVEETPWHGLGQRLTRGAPLEVWAREAGMEYAVQDALLTFKGIGGKSRVYTGRKALFRSDTGEELGLVGTGYKVVQPLEVLEFFRDLVATGGFELETAGVLYKGAKYWALARTGHDAVIGGRNSKDRVKGYLLLATACDGTLQTTAQFTNVRVVCNNTLTASVLDPSDKIGAIKVSHRSTFDEQAVKKQLGLDAGWAAHVETLNTLAKIKVDSAAASMFLTKLLGDTRHATVEQKLASRPVATALQLFQGKGRGSDMKSSDGTAWGLVNAVTEYVDHYAGKNQDQRLKMAWFYDGNVLKQEAVKRALELA